MSSRRVVARAPGRVNLIGDHTDYNDGFVLPMALPFATTLTASSRPGRTVKLTSAGFPDVEFSLDDPPGSVASWGRFVAGMAAFLAEDGIEVQGFEAMISTDIPVGASLSSSAALEVAAGFAICGLAGVAPDPVRIAQLGQRVENEVIGVQSGIMDQLISAVAEEGAVTRIDCRSLETSPVLLPERARVVIMDTMTRRELADSEYDLRRAACERAAAALGVAKLRDATLDDVATLTDDTDRRRAHHIVSENRRVLETVDALAMNDLDRTGELMNESHQSLSVDYEVSSAALDRMAEIARAHPNCWGARMTGGGFAGSAVALVDAAAVDGFVETVQSIWKRETGVLPDLWAVVPSAGAQLDVAVA